MQKARIKKIISNIIELMNAKCFSVIFILFLITGCQSSAIEMSPQPPITSTPTSLTPTLTPQVFIHQPEHISKGKLDCSSLGRFTRCIDDILGIQFEYPTIWGEIETKLGTGGYTGFAYFYYFGGKMPGETEPLVAGGRSRDFSEGRGWMPTDFAGYGNVGIQSKENCEPRNLYTLCEEVQSKVSWMIRFPNATYLCDGFLSTMLYPTFRIEINLPNNPTINGFVFEAPFLSEQFYNQIKTELYPLLGIDIDMPPTNCADMNQQAFDNQLIYFLEKIIQRTSDEDTPKNLDDLIHLANSIQFR